MSTPTYIYARFNDGYNTSANTIHMETKIDTTTPSAPTVIKGVYTDWTVIDDLTKYHNKTVYFPQVGKNGEKLVSGAIDNESGIARYEISSDNKTWYDLSKYNATGVYSTTTSTTRYYRAVNNVGLSSEATKVDIKIDITNPTVSYSLAGGTYNAYQTVRVTPSDENYASMAVHVYKNGALVYSGKVDAKSTNSTSASYYDVSLDSDGTWTIYTVVYDKAGNKAEYTYTENNVITETKITPDKDSEGNNIIYIETITNKEVDKVKVNGTEITAKDDEGTYCFKPSENGTYTIDVIYKDGTTERKTYNETRFTENDKDNSGNNGNSSNNSNSGNSGNSGNGTIGNSNNGSDNTTGKTGDTITTSTALTELPKTGSTMEILFAAIASGISAIFAWLKQKRQK